MTSITVDDWLSALKAAGFDDAPDGMTINELSEASGLCRTAMRNRMVQAIRQGLAELAGFRESTRIDGKACRVPVYRMKEAKKCKKA